MLLSIREWYMDRKKLINQSIDYIMKHLDENLSLDTVAAHFLYRNTTSAESSRKKPAKVSMHLSSAVKLTKAQST